MFLAVIVIQRKGLFYIVKKCFLNILRYILFSFLSQSKIVHF